jgi:hypothetical protein
MQHLRSFISGFLSTLIFHQGLLAVLYAGGISPRGAYSMSAVPPLGIPSVLSLAFWGGVWGIALWLMIRKSKGITHWSLALILGAVLPSVVALFIVFPMKGMPMGGGYDPKLIVGALLLNGAWGLGVAFFMKMFGASAK